MASKRKRLPGRRVDLILAIAACMLIIVLGTLLLLSPAESRLGSLIKLVYVHGALVWVGLSAFSAAGILGLAGLVLRRPGWYLGTRAALRSAVILWMIYTVSAILVTGLAWGQWVAWNEPRVRVTALILLGSVVVALADRLIDMQEFTAVASLVLGVAAWVAVRQAEVIRHPVDPIGSSGSASIQGFYLAIVAAVAGLGALLVDFLWSRYDRQASTRSGEGRSTAPGQ